MEVEVELNCVRLAGRGEAVTWSKVFSDFTVAIESLFGSVNEIDESKSSSSHQG